MADKPFALIGVNTNGYQPDKLKAVMDKEKLTWRSFADVSDKELQGPIASAWKVQGTPTLFLLDHKGVILYRWFASASKEKIDEAIEKLIKEADGG